MIKHQHDDAGVASSTAAIAANKRPNGQNASGSSQRSMTSMSLPLSRIRKSKRWKPILKGQKAYHGNE